MAPICYDYLMRIAIVHDWFDQIYGGSERVAIHFCKLFPNAEIFTLLYNSEAYGNDLGNRIIHKSSLQRLPVRLRANHKILLPLIPKALARFDFSGYDLVISSSPAFSKNINVPENIPHITYCHSPMRFAWDYWPEYLHEQDYGVVQKLLAKLAIPRIRKWDLEGAKRIKYWLANSETVKQRIQKYYQIDEDKITVLNPPVEIAEAPRAIAKRDEYYVTLATLTPYKRIDLAIKACNVSRRKLIVIGDGPARKDLEQMAGDTIRFVGFVSGKEKWELLRRAQGLIFPQVEDFGMAPIEALAVGTPTIAFRQGGVTETITDGKFGILFDEQTSESIVDAIDRSETSKFNVDKMREAAQAYSTENFDREFMKYINKITDVKD